MQARDEIAKILKSVSGVEDPHLDFASNEQFGDYSSNIALKNKDLDPQEIADKFNKKTGKFEATVVGRFVNFWVKDSVLVDNLSQVDANYGKSNFGAGKLAIVEYSSPNIAKPFGVGHLRSTIIGDSIANLMEAVGYKVLRDNHLGDWGTQFGKIICAIKKWGDIKDIENSKDPIDELNKLYVKFHDEAKENPELEDEARAWFKKLEDGDKEARDLWQKCVDWSWVEFEKIYKLLNIKFSKEFNDGRGLGESYFEGRMPAVISELKEKKILKKGEGGAQLVFFKDEKYSPLMILKKDGSTLYSTRDLATDKYRLEKYNPDLIINEVGSEQSLYFKQIFEVEKMLGWYKEGQRVHVGHGLFLLDGKKMSTRAGKTIKLEDVLDEAIKKTTAKEIGIGAVKYFDLSHHPSTNINFDWDKMLSLEGNSGPYLQYTFARTQSVLKKTDGKLKVDGKIKLENEEELVLRALAKFPEAVEDAAKNYSPNLICNYLYDLSQKYNSFYNAHKIIGGENEEFRLVLTKSVGQVLKNGLTLLGIYAPEKM